MKHMENRNNVTVCSPGAHTESKDAEDCICCVLCHLHQHCDRKCAYHAHHHCQPVLGIAHVLFPGLSLLY